MKRPFLLLLTALFPLIFCACGTASPLLSDSKSSPTDSTEPAVSQTASDRLADAADSTIEIRVKTKTFRATLYNNASAGAFTRRLPLTLRMEELNGNEKYFYFSQRLPSDSIRVQQVRAGDLMLYGDDCIVLFYKDFSTSNRYTPLGRIEDRNGLSDALGGGSAFVSFHNKLSE